MSNQTPKCRKITSVETRILLIRQPYWVLRDSYKDGIFRPKTKN